LLKLNFTIKDKPHTNVLFADCAKLGLTWDQIIDQVNAIQVAQPEQKRVLLEQDSKHITRFVTHLQTPQEGVERLVTLLKEAIAQLKK
jgi:threonine aldolase